MKLLFQYSDYVSLLTHENEVVRLWAFEAIKNRHGRKFTPEVAGFLGDANQHLACTAPRYLADHRAMEYAPAILDSFHSGQGPAPGNCAMALGVLGYLPAKDAMLQRLSHCESPDTFLGICSYLGLVKDDDCRYALLDILEQVSDEYFVGAVAGHLLRHGQTDDVSFVLSFCPKQTSPPRFLADILEPLGGKDIYSHLTQPSGRTFMEEPGESLNRVLRWHSGIEVDTSLRAELPGLINTERYKELAAVLTLESEKEIKARYEPFVLFPDELTALKEKDALALRFITEVGRSYFWSKQGPSWQDKHGGLFASMVAAHLAILRRRCVVPAIAPNATHEQMILCLAGAEKDLPESVVERLISRAEVKGLAAALSDGLTSIGDQDIVELLGRCPQQTAVDELLRIVRDTDGLAILHDTAAQALRQMEPSGQEMILERLIQGRLEDALDIMSQLEHLPYAESFDLALKQWDRGGVDYIESYAHCLAGIGDPRGIAELQKLWSVYESLSVGRALETLAALHDRQIPELPEIRRMEQESKRFQAERRQEFAEMAANIDRLGGDPFGIPEPVETVRRDGPKVGRNDPCPCGSGKKYKKCCLRKS